MSIKQLFESDLKQNLAQGRSLALAYCMVRLEAYSICQKLQIQTSAH